MDPLMRNESPSSNRGAVVSVRGSVVDVHAGSRSTITTVRIADSTDEPRTMLVRSSFQPSLQTRPHVSSLKGCTTHPTKLFGLLTIVDIFVTNPEQQRGNFLFCENKWQIDWRSGRRRRPWLSYARSPDHAFIAVASAGPLLGTITSLANLALPF
jgi:hypothetical protein